MALNASPAGFLLGLPRSRRDLPERLPATDVALLGVATYKLTRLLSKDLVTSPLRAPFTHLEELTGPNEVKESARGHGLRQAIGELLKIPFFPCRSADGRRTVADWLPLVALDELGDPHQTRPDRDGEPPSTGAGSQPTPCVKGRRARCHRTADRGCSE